MGALEDLAKLVGDGPKDPTDGFESPPVVVTKEQLAQGCADLMAECQSNQVAAQVMDAAKKVVSMVAGALLK